MLASEEIDFHTLSFGFLFCIFLYLYHNDFISQPQYVHLVTGALQTLKLQPIRPQLNKRALLCQVIRSACSLTLGYRTTLFGLNRTKQCKLVGMTKADVNMIKLLIETAAW